MKCIIATICLFVVASCDDVRLVNLDPPEAQQLIESKDTSLKYAPKVESNVPRVKVNAHNEPQNVNVDLYLANQYHGQDGLGGYLYGYSVPDIAKTEKKQAGGELRGSYNYLTNEGKEVKVQYWDDGTGFHQTDNIPEISPQPEEEPPALKAARLEHLRIWQEQAIRNSKPVENPYPDQSPGAYAGLGAGVGAGQNVPQASNQAYSYTGQSGHSTQVQGLPKSNQGQGYQQGGGGYNVPSVNPGIVQSQPLSGQQGQGYQQKTQQFGGQQTGQYGQQQQQYGTQAPPLVRPPQQGQYYGAAQSQQVGGSQGQQYGSSSGQQQGNAQGQQYGASAGQQQGNLQGKPQGQVQGQQYGANPGQQQGNIQGQQHGASSGQQQGNLQGQQHGQGQQYGGAQGQQYGGTQGQQYGGAQGQHGGQQKTYSPQQGQQDYTGQYSENQNAYASSPQAHQAQGSSDNDDGTYKDDDAGAWKDDTNNEEQGPPKGFFYNFDYLAEKVVSPNENQLGANLQNTYQANKANYQQQLQTGAAVHGGSGSYPNYQVHA